MKWVTRERPKIDRIACPWLIKRFIDDQAEFIFVPPEQVEQKAREVDGIPFDIQGVEYTHYGEYCTFDYIVKKHGIDDPAIAMIAPIVRGADTDRFDLAPQSAGLWAISSGMSHNHSNDHEMLAAGMVVYDALYSWARHHRHEKHTWEPMEDLLLEVFDKVIRRKYTSAAQPPAWAGKLKELIQDQIDTNYGVNLKEIAKAVKLHPDYISRRFKEYFESLSFGEYIRKRRIDKAIELMQSRKHSAAEVAYLTGFSDQSYFTRVFKKVTGLTPSQFMRNVGKGGPLKLSPKKHRTGSGRKAKGRRPKRRAR